MPFDLSKRGSYRYLLAVLSGVLLGFAFPTSWTGPTSGLLTGLFAFVALVPLLYATEETGLKATFRLAFVAMFVLGIIANYWVGGWKATGEVDPFLMLGGVLLALVHPFFLVLPFVLLKSFQNLLGQISTPDSSRWNLKTQRFAGHYALYSLPIFYAGFEYWHSFGDLSYPWLSFYNTQTYNLAFVQFIEWTGPFALTMLIVFVNIEIYQLLRFKKSSSPMTARPRRRLIHLALLILAIGVPYLYGSYALDQQEPSSGSLRVTVVQPNIDPWAKWQTDEERILDTNFAASSAALAAAHDSTDLIIWPETAVTFFITSPSHGPQLRELYNFLIEIRTPILTGFPDREEYIVGRDSIPTDAIPEQTRGWYMRSWNAAMLLQKAPDGRISRQIYHKQKLVPLGEHVPFVGTFPILGRIFQWGVGLGSWNVGTSEEPLLLTRMNRQTNDGLYDSIRISPLICYESVYPSFVRKFVKNGAQVLSIITNDGWYGTSAGPYQHEQFAVLRAIENRRWIARSANTGISTFLDDRGRTHGTTPLFQEAFLTHNVPILHRLTFYTRFGDFIAIPAMIFSGLVLLLAIIARLRRKRSQSTVHQ